MTFSDVLRDFVKLSGTSLKEIAESVGYEDSYISKWYNGKNIPSSQNLGEILDRLAKFFADNFSDDSLKGFISSYPYIRDVLHQRELVSVLRSVLYDAYIVSITKKDTKEGVLNLIGAEVDQVFFAGQEEYGFKPDQLIPVIQINNLYRISHEIIGLAYRYMTLAMESSTLYSDFDFLRYMPDDYVEIMTFTYTKSCIFTVATVASKGLSRKENCEIMGRYLLVAYKVSFINLNVYEEDESTQIFMAMKGAYAGYGIQLDPTDIEASILFCSIDVKTADRLHQFLEERFNNRKKLIYGMKGSQEAVTQIERLKGEEYVVFLMPFLHSGLGGPDLFKALNKENRLQEFCIRSFDMMENIFKSVKRTKLILLKSAFDRLREDHTVDFYSFTTLLDKEEIKEYYAGLNQTAQAYNMEIVVYDDTKEENKGKVPLLAILSTGKEALYVKPETLIHEELSYYFTFDSEELSLAVLDYLEGLETSPLTQGSFFKGF